MVRLVLFDIDGTLISSGGAGVRAFGLAGQSEFGVPNGSGPLKFAGRTDISLVREFFTRNNIEPSPPNFTRFFNAYLGWLPRMLAETDGGLCRGVHDFFVQLESLPNPPALGLLTGNIRRGAQIKLGHYGIWQKFPFGAFADDHEDRDQIAVIARERGSRHLGHLLQGPEILVIGDTPLDIRCARAIGARILAVATGGFPANELKTHSPDWVVEDLTLFSDKTLFSD